MINKFLHLFRRCNCLIFASSLGLSVISILALASITRLNRTFLSREVLIQSVALVTGMIAAAVVLMLGYRYFTDKRTFIYALSLILLISVYLPGIGTSFYGSRSWLDFGLITFQPSELVKVFFIVIMASFLSNPNLNLHSLKDILVTALFAMPFILVVAKEDFGSGCVYCAIWIFMVFCSGLDLKFIYRFFLSLTALLPMLYYFLEGYQKERIDAFLNPSDLSLSGNYQVWNSKVSIGSGGLLGKGYMNGIQARFGFLPVPESDFIFASIVEESGFIGGAIVIFLIGLLLFSAMKTARYANDLEGTLIAAGISGMFFFQAFENIAMNMGLMPVTGITLPFLSYGGSSMLSSMIAIGFLLSVSCNKKI